MIYYMCTKLDLRPGSLAGLLLRLPAAQKRNKPHAAPQLRYAAPWAGTMLDRVWNHCPPSAPPQVKG